MIVEEVPTFSERVEAQRVGRGARKWAGNPNKMTYSVVMLDKGQTGAALIGEMEGWELKPKEFEFPAGSIAGKPGPNLPPEYPDIPVHVVADAREIAEFKRRKQEATPCPRRPKPEDFWSSEEFGQAIKLAKPRVGDQQAAAIRIIKAIRTQHEAAGAAQYRDVPVPRGAIAEYDGPNGTAFSIRSIEGQAIADALGREREKPADFWTGKELGEAIQKAEPGVTTAPAALGSRIIGVIRERLESGEPGTFRGITVGREAFCEYDFNGQVGFAVRKDEGQRIADSYAIKQEKPPGYLGGRELGDAIRSFDPTMDPAIGYDVIAKLRQQLKTSPVATFRKIPVPEDAIVEYRYLGTPASALRKSECDLIAKTYDNEQARTPKNRPPPGYWTSSQLGDAIAAAKPGINAKSMGNRILVDLRRKLESIDTTSYKGVAITRDALVSYEYNSLPATAIREAEGEQIARAFATMKSAPLVGYITGSMLSEAIEAACPDVEDVGSFGNLIISRIRAQHQGQELADYKGVPVPRDAIDEYEATNGRTAYGLRQAEADAIVAAYKTDEKAKFGIKPKRLKPGGEDLKRTGFSPDRS